MKRIILIILLFILLLEGVALATLTYDETYYMQHLAYLHSGSSTTDPMYLFINEVIGYVEGSTAQTSLYLNPTDTAPTASEGQLYYNDTGNALTFYNGSAWVTVGTSSGGDSLDTAYNNGNGITVDGTAVTLTVADGDNNSALAIVSAATTNDVDAVTITTTTAAYTGDSLYINGVTGSTDIRGDNWNVSQAGLFTIAGGITINTGGELLVSARDVLFDDTYDVAWDTSADMLIFQDNAVLGIGGAHDGAADVTIKWDASNMLVESATEDTGEIQFGATNAIDVVMYANTNTSEAMFNANTATLELNGYDVQVMDDDKFAFGDSDEFVIEYNEDNNDELLIVAANANDAVIIGTAAANTDFTMQGTTAATYATFDASADEMFFDLADLKISDQSQIEFVDASDGIDWSIDCVTAETLLIYPTETTDDQTVNLGNATNTTDLRLFGATASTVVFDASGDEVIYNAYDISLQDDDIIKFGDGDDWHITSGTAKTLDVIPGATADSTAVLNIGADGAGADLILFGETASQTTWWDASTDQWFFGADAEGIDVTFYGDTASSYMKWDENGGTNGMLLVEAADISLGDSDLLLFGDAIGTGDIKVYATGTDLIIDGVVAETGTVAIGLTDVGLDFKLWAATAAEGVLWDASDEALEFTGANITLNAASILTLGQTVNADVLVTTGTYAVLVANSGKVHVIPDLAGNTAINLPAEADGLYYKFIYCGAAADAHDHTIDSESNTNYFIGGVAFIDSDAGAGADEHSTVSCDGNSNSEIVCNNLENGSVIELHCDGTNWYLTGTIYSDTTPTVADN